MKKARRSFSEADWQRLREALAPKAEPDPAERAEQIRRVLSERAERYAAQALAAEVEAGRDVLGFRCAGERFAVECRYVIEVGSRELTRVPGAPPRLLGLANLRGEILPVFDLLRALGRAGDDSQGSHLIVLGAGVPEVGILAQSLDGVARLEDRELRVLPNPSALPDSVVLGVTSDAVTVLDIKVLLDGPAFLLEAPSEPRNSSLEVTP
jgi:purine-binding chemotaxis protein CheW